LSAFTAAELDYLASQRLGRLATLGPDGAPQNRPVGFRYNPQLDTIDIAGRNMGSSRKYRNVAADARVAFVVDDLASTDPWRPRGVEVRGRAETVPGSETGRELIRIHPERVLGWGLDTNAFAPPHSRDVPSTAGD
jgi:pyridoxamine 5'-phosphate oxidase family protein